MTESGAGTLLIGVESGSPSVRDHMQKGYSDEDLQRLMKQVAVACHPSTVAETVLLKWLHDVFP